MKIKVSVDFYLIWLFFLLTGQTQTVLTVFICGMLHEAAHIYAYGACGIKNADLTITACGISADFKGRVALSYGREIICLTAGGIFNLVLAGLFALLGKYLPPSSGAEQLCLCNLAFGLLNLLPIYPLDGGRALFSLLAEHLPLYAAGRISKGISLVFLAPLTVFAGWIVWSTRFNISLLLICFYLAYYIASGR